MKRRIVCLLWSARMCFLFCCGLISVVGYSAELAPVYQAMESISGKDIPGLKLTMPDFAGYGAIRFGANPKEVLMFVLDCKANMKPHDILGLYVAGHEIYGKPVFLNGRKKGDQMLSFKKIKLTTVFDDVELTYDILFTVRTLWDKQKIDLDYEAVCNAHNKVTGKTYRFALYGGLDPMMNPNAACIVKRFIEKPILNVAWDHRSDPPYIRCRIVAGAGSFVPLSGFSTRANINIAI